MPEKYQPRLESTKIGDFPFETIQKDIEHTLQYLKIDQSKFKHPLPELVKKLIRFLGEYEINYITFTSYDRILKGLCIVDSWMSAVNTKDKGRLQKLKSTIDRFKLLCVISDNDTQTYRQISKKILEQSKKGSERSKLFDPDAELDDSYRQMVNQAVFDIMDNHIDKDRTKFVNQHILDILPQLKVLLQSSSAYNESGKLPFRINILNLSKRELVNYPISDNLQLGWGAICIGNPKNRRSRYLLVL